MAKKKGAAELSVDERCDQFINDIKVIRESKDITTAGLAELTGIAQPNITRMETGGVKPNLKTIVTIAFALGMDIALVERK